MEDDASVGELIAAVLNAAQLEVAVACNAAEALPLARIDPPAVAILDINLGSGMSGYELCHQLRAELGSDLRVVFISGTRTDDLDQRAGLLLGGDAYLVKPFEPESLLSVVTRLLGPRSDGRGAGRADLTRRETEILTLISAGVSRKSIAQQLGISPKTVGSHVERAAAKLGASTQAHAVTKALRLGLLPQEALDLPA